MFDRIREDGCSNMPILNYVEGKAKSRGLACVIEKIH